MGKKLAPQLWYRRCEEVLLSTSAETAASSSSPGSPQSLVEHLTAPDKRRRVIADCCLLIDEEVSKKSGFSGAAIKLGYGTVKAVKPGFIAEAVDHLLDDFARRLEPFYKAHQGLRAGGSSRSLPDHFAGESSAIAEALLGITDDRAARAPGGVVTTSYEKLRPTAKKHVEEAIPAVGRLIDKHTR
jgi:hypothetical protein